MLRVLLALGLVTGIVGCGSKEQEAVELKQYVQTIRKFDDYNRKVEATIVRFDDPTADVTRADIEAARSMLAEYGKAVEGVSPPSETSAKNTHGLYARGFDEANRLATDETGDVKRQAHSVAIGLRALRRTVEDRVYPTFEVLLSRYHLSGPEYELKWPAD